MVGLEVVLGEYETYLFNIGGEIKTKWHESIYVSDIYFLEKKVDSKNYYYLYF
ncbi:MAG: hypothetical protein QMD06_03050 [Candidatus Altarchaeum sp.]|nr:hypothetical protein [Candidatus Altarchaeum sp.]